ncbi:MAG: hypothetical protein QXS00_06170 [Pyrobaculum sp.]|uniref:hypothetical protein n=1 Tax=Pyrobaculum sp. TaxID=2004705 RepID=UPI0031653172
MKSSELLLRATKNPDEIAKLALDVLLYYAREIGCLYGDFRKEPRAGDIDVGEYAALAEELEKRLDVEYIRGAIQEMTGRGEPEVDDGLFYDLPALLQRVGCRLGRDDLVLQ